MRRISRLLVALVVIALAVVTAAYANTSSSRRSTGADGRLQLMADHRGGTLKLLAKAAGGTLDPQVNYTLAVLAALPGDVRRPAGVHQGGRSGGVQRRPRHRGEDPDADERRQDVGVQDPQGNQVLERQGSHARPTSLASFQRIFKVKSPTSGGFYAGIIGADACLKKPATCTLKGGVSRERGGAHRHDQPEGARSRVQVQAGGSACVDPAGRQPAQGRRHDADSRDRVVLLRLVRPEQAAPLEAQSVLQAVVRGAQPNGYPDEIAQSFGLTVEAQITAIQNGQADWTLEQPPADRLGQLSTQYASQVHVNPLTAFWYAPMNTNLPPFNSVKARQAVNYAINRNAAVKIFGGTKLAVSVVPGAASGLPRPQAVLPVHEEPGNDMVGARPRQGEGARQAVGHRRSEGGRRLVRRRGEQGGGGLPPERAQPDRLQGVREADLRRTSSSPTRRTRRTRSRSTCSSGTRTTPPHRTSSTSCSAASRSTPAATRASTSPVLRQEDQRADAQGARSGASTRTPQTNNCGRRSTRW